MTANALSALLFAALVTVAGTAGARAAEPFAVNDLDGTDVVIELGVRGTAKPTYEGSDEIIFAPSPIVKLNYLELPGLFTIGGGPATAFSIRPAFNVVGERDGDDVALGLDDVDAALEIGFGASYRVGPVRAVGEVRRGFGGHEGIVGEVGVDLVVEPTDRLMVSVGPRASFSDDEYADTYFTVSPAEATLSGLPAYDADSGLKGVGVEAELRYAVNEDWTVYSDASYTRLVEDAGDSPIVESEDQVSVGLGITRRFRFDLFD